MIILHGEQRSNLRHSRPALLYNFRCEPFYTPGAQRCETSFDARKTRSFSSFVTFRRFLIKRDAREKQDALFHEATLQLFTRRFAICFYGPVRHSLTDGMQIGRIYKGNNRALYSRNTSVSNIIPILSNYPECKRSPNK